MDFTEWLKSQMAHYRLTIYQISKKSGVHQTTIKNWLNGAKPQGTKADAVKIAVQALIKENDALLNSLPWEQAAAENAILNERIKKDAPGPQAESDLERRLRDIAAKLPPDFLEREIAYLEQKVKQLHVPTDSDM